MNYPQQSAQGLASLGRGNDSMLVHMTPNEVQGLQGLAMAHGGSLSINPQTGLPEAGILDFVLPVAGSFLGLPPWLTASLMAGKTLIEGGDLGDAAMAGLTSYGGAKIGEGLSSFGAAPKVPTAELNAVANAPYTGLFGANGQLGANMGFGSTATSLTDDLVSSIDDIGTKLPSNVGANALAKTQSFAPDFSVGNAYKGGIDLGNQNLTNLAKQDYLISPTSTTPTTGMTNLGESFASRPVGVDIPGATQASSNNFGEISRFGDAVGSAAKDPVGFARHIGDGDALYGGAKIGMYGASPFLEGMLTPPEYAGYEDPEKGKYTGPQGQLNLSDRYSTGLKLLPNLNNPITAKEGGIINAYAQGGTIQTGGIKDLYGNNDDQLNDNLSRDGYGIGRLNTLASQESLNEAKTLGYADGGYLDGQGDGMSDSIPATIEGKQPARLADGEFVVPADVVSHLGNGSSKAGSKRLYAMLDKVRHARTGNKKQGKQINPSKYMPV